MKKLLIFVFFGLLFSNSFAQTGITGLVVDEFGEPFVGVTVHDITSNKATVTDLNGKFTLTLSAGKHTVEFRFVSYKTDTVSVTLTDGEMKNLDVIEMQSSAIGINTIKVVADRAKERETPVAFSTLNKKDITRQLGSRDIPLAMNITPSVYATSNGGGSGDARINVRGFNQRNVSIMINGVPVNDMENGWVYWSNWDGLADVTSSIQMQRGMSAVNLATPSIGGTMNIITNPAELKSGGIAKFEYGSGNFMKYTLAYNSGLIKDKFAFSFAGVRKTGNGVVDATWTDAWAYYFGASYQINKNQRLELFALGAPQRHGQNLYKQNVAAYSTEYAQKIGANLAADNITQSPSGILYNENWHPVSSSYTGKQYWNGKLHDRHSPDFINERENYYHKPIVNLNWYSQWTKKIRQSTILYYSGGKGGGSGTFGHMVWDYNTPSRSVDWDGTIAQNTQSDTAFGILRNSVNQQWTIGAISRLDIFFNPHFKGAAGIDWRTAQIEHFREVRDLLGGKFFYFDGNEFDSPQQYNKGLGDKIDYHFTNTVDWIGYFAQLEYTSDKFTAYGTFGNSYIKYSHVNHFKKDPNDPSKELSAVTDYLPGYQLKGGAAFRPIKQLKIFANLGYISKAPIFDNVINDRTATIANNPKNELFESVEGGVDYASLDKRFIVNTNYYYTLWLNRAYNVNIVNQDGSEGIVFIQGMNELHQGVELETKFKPVKYFGFGVFGSIANWQYTNDVTGTYKDYTSGGAKDTTFNYFVKGLKVGDSPQSQYGAILQFYPVKGLFIQFDARYYDNYYANWDPFSRTDSTDRGQVWKIPAYYLLDAHFSYNFKIKDKVELTIFGHVFNMLNQMYISDATDNSRYNAYPFGAKTHDANSAEVFMGLPRTFNLGMSVKF